MAISMWTMAEILSNNMPILRCFEACHLELTSLSPQQQNPLRILGSSSRDFALHLVSKNACLGNSMVTFKEEPYYVRHCSSPFLCMSCSLLKYF